MMLRKGIAGSLTDDELARLVGDRIDRYRHLGNTDAERGTAEWRTLARALCIAEYEALARVVERDEGDFTGTPSHPVLVNVTPAEEYQKTVSLVTFTGVVTAGILSIGLIFNAVTHWFI